MDLKYSTVMPTVAGTTFTCFTGPSYQDKSSGMLWQIRKDPTRAANADLVIETGTRNLANNVCETVVRINDNAGATELVPAHHVQLSLAIKYDRRYTTDNELNNIVAIVSSILSGVEAEGKLPYGVRFLKGEI